MECHTDRYRICLRWVRYLAVFTYRITFNKRGLFDGHSKKGVSIGGDTVRRTVLFALVFMFFMSFIVYCLNGGLMEIETLGMTPLLHMYRDIRRLSNCFGGLS